MTRSKIAILVGDRIRLYREREHKSQEELAYDSDVNPTYIGRIERGEKCPTIETVYKISKGLKIPLTELLDIESNIAPTKKEALDKFQLVIADLTDEESVKLVKLIEEIISLHK